MSYVYGGRGTKTFGRLPGYKNLVVWQKASDLADLVHEATKGFGPGYFKLADQMRDASESVPSNIAEGYSAASIGLYIRHCLIARGSLGETGNHILHCERWGLIAPDLLDRILALYSDTSFLLDRLLQSLNQKQKEGTWDRDFWAKEERAEYHVNPTAIQPPAAGADFPDFPDFPEFPELLEFLEVP